MRRRIILTMVALLLTLCLTIVKPVAQQPVVDSQKSRQELETMEGILSTTLGYAVKRLATTRATEGEKAFRLHAMGGQEVSGYYLYGQGAVFMIPISALQRHKEFAYDFGELTVGVTEMSYLAAAEATAVLQKVSPDVAIAGDDAEKAEEKALKQPQKAEERQKELTKNLEKQKEKIQQLQEKAKKRRAEMEESHKQLIARLGQVKVDLKDALARYGDSLSIVKPEESVTIILSDNRGFRWGDSEGDSICHVLTVKKSLVTDLKAGKITREEFDRRVVDYSY